MSHTKKPKVALPKLQISLRFSKRVWFLIAVGFVLLIGVAGTAYAFYYQDRYLPRTYVGGVSVGGLTKAQAQTLLDAKQANFSANTLTFSYNDKTWTVAPGDLGITANSTVALADEWNAERAGNWDRQLLRLFAAPVLPRNRVVTLGAMSDTGSQVLKSKVLTDIETPLNETGLQLTPGNVTVLLGKAGQRLDAAAFYTGLEGAFNKNLSTVGLQLESSQPEVTAAMAESARARAASLLSAPLGVHFNAVYFSVDPTQLATWIGTDVERDVSGAATGLKLLLLPPARKALDDWQGQVDQAAHNARLEVEKDGTLGIAQADSPGITLEKDKTYTVLQNYVSGTDNGHSVQGVTDVALADVRAETLANLGIKELVGTAVTDFSGSPVNRTFNIKKGAALISSILVRSGDTFSTLATLGPIELSTGWLPELVIKNNRTVADAGGGLCQVSTTLFRSVLNAGMPIVERQNHAYRVGYYERGTGPGLDATIFEPSPDFKWKNDFPTAMYIQSTIVGNTIRFDLYGTKDGRVSTITPPTILETYPVGAPIYANSDTLPVGTTQQVEHAHDGAKTSVTYTVSRAGAQIYNKTFISVYKAWPAQYLVGTKPVTPTP